MKEEELKYIKSQVGISTAYADCEARNYFHEGISIVKLKCIAKFNHYREWNFKINKDLVIIEYLQCTIHKDWYYIIWCKAVREE